MSKFNALNKKNKIQNDLIEKTNEKKMYNNLQLLQIFYG